MTTVVITGVASGMGAALRDRLEGQGATVIGVDLPGTGATVEADLATVDGRTAMAAAVTERSGGAIDGLVAGAGMQSMDGQLAGRTVRTNYFGAVATLDPEVAAKMAQVPTLACMRPPGSQESHLAMAL